ncbi:hypothetical protein STCU_12155 [Strigomonas culicis]|uniref:Uncharacterized protein n=1 Tax=Strigomonas culicis TaxID=28005 RepID=S9UXM3_9TRYP|nr:hypothetical protein STCU_12155 [Strigomonas culicis]|eukprot:EPY15290.1 hypothetical protein STCU_12155 [Strigomonas culicis]
MRLREFRSCLSDIAANLADFTEEEFHLMGLTFAVPGVRELSSAEVAAFNEQLRRSGAGGERRARSPPGAAAADPPPRGDSSAYSPNSTVDSCGTQINLSSEDGSLSVARPPLLLPLFNGGERMAVERDQFTRFKEEVDRKLEEVEERLAWASVQQEETQVETLNDDSGSDGF